MNIYVELTSYLAFGVVINVLSLINVVIGSGRCTVIMRTESVINR